MSVPRSRKKAPRTVDSRAPIATVGSWSDDGLILEAPVVVPRENKELARKAVAGRCHSAGELRELLDMLGLMDNDTLPEGGRDAAAG